MTASWQSRVGGRVKAWLADTLFKRLFALMWLALVVSHAVAFLVVARNGPATVGRLPTFPSLPPFPMSHRAATAGPLPFPSQDGGNLQQLVARPRGADAPRTR